MSTSEVKAAYRIRMDSAGAPVMLADVPPAGVSRVDSDAESGNPRHDIRSGKFAPGKKPRQAEPPPNTDPLDFKRMIDAVRDAAREFDSPDIGDIKEFLSGRAKAPDQVDVRQFLALVQEQRKNDAVDLFDQQLRSSGVLPTGRRKVRISAPRGYTRRLLGSLDGDQLGEIMHRLEAKGHDPDDLTKFFSRKVSDEVASAASARRSSIQASDWQGSPQEDFDFEDAAVWAVSEDELGDLAEKIALHLRAGEASNAG